jgi:8-oxo-dGTP pyrophosphatase MutT (NUDIX family)
MSETPGHPIRRVREVTAYANRFVHVFDDEVRFPDETSGRYLRIVHAGPGTGVVLLALCDQAVALVRSYRYPLGEWQWALPRGFAQHEDLLLTARAELREELGHDSTDLQVLGYITPDSGIRASKVAVVAARIPHDRAMHPRDQREIAEARWVTPDDLAAMAARKELEDGMSLAALALAHTLGIIELRSSHDAVLAPPSGTDDQASPVQRGSQE